MRVSLIELHADKNADQRTLQWTEPRVIVMLQFKETSVVFEPWDTYTNMQKCVPKHLQTNISKSMFVQACTLVQTHARNDTDSKELVWVIREVTEVDASNVW